MKIAIIAGRDPQISTDTDGGSVYLEYLQSKLQKDMHDVTTYIPHGIQGGLVSQEREYLQKNKEINSKNRIIYFPITELNLNNKISSQEDYFYHRIEISNAFVEYFSDKKLFKYDVVFILHCANAFGIAHNDLLPFGRTVLFPMMTSFNYKKFTSVPEEYIKLEQETIIKMQHISTPSEDELNILINIFSASSSSVFKTHRGFSIKDFPFFQHTKPRNSKKITIFSANGIRPQKDHMFFIDLGLTLLSLGITPQILLTGNNGRSHNPNYNAYTSAFWQHANEVGISQYITAYDVVPRSKLVALMRDANIALYPSISETFGKSALESAVSGLPTVVFDDIPAFTEFITHNKTGIITPRDVNICAHEIIDICTKNEQLYKYISQQGTTLREYFNWDKVFSTLFEQLQLRGIM